VAGFIGGLGHAANLLEKVGIGIAAEPFFFAKLSFRQLRHSSPRAFQILRGNCCLITLGPRSGRTVDVSCQCLSDGQLGRWDVSACAHWGGAAVGLRNSVPPPLPPPPPQLLELARIFSMLGGATLRFMSWAGLRLVDGQTWILGSAAR